MISIFLALQHKYSKVAEHFKIHDDTLHLEYQKKKLKIFLKLKGRVLSWDFFFHSYSQCFGRETIQCLYTVEKKKKMEQYVYYVKT